MEKSRTDYASLCTLLLNHENHEGKLDLFHQNREKRRHILQITPHTQCTKTTHRSLISVEYVLGVLRIVVTGVRTCFQLYSLHCCHSESAHVVLRTVVVTVCVHVVLGCAAVCQWCWH